MITALAIVFVLGTMIIVHELGHYGVAKLFGVKVLEFSFGFGPKLLGYQGKETLYALRIIPLGGYVKLYGMDAEVDEKGNEVLASSSDPRSFMNKPVWQRMAVIAAGPIMNFILAIVLFICVFAYMGIPTQDSGNAIGTLIQDKPAAAAGLQPGDKILAVNGETTPDWTALTGAIHSKPDQVLSLTLERAESGEQQILDIKTELDPQTGNGIIGVYPVTTYAHASILQAAGLGIERTFDFTKYVIVAVVQMVTGKIPADVGGPVMIAQVIGEGAEQGLADLLSLTGVLSIQLGLLNLFPIPALDGSRLVFLFLEGVRGRPLNPEKENMIHLVGFVLLMALMLVITYKDIMRLFIREG